jgi:hypothetical protein
MAASLRPVTVEVSQLATNLAASWPVILRGSLVRGRAAIAGTASTSERSVMPVAWKKRSSERRAVTMARSVAGRRWSIAERTTEMTSRASSSATAIGASGHQVRMQPLAYLA